MTFLRLLLLFCFTPPSEAFEEESYTFAVSEDAVPGHLIGRIPLRSDGLRYRVSRGDERILFDARSGQISLLVSVDRERSNGTISLLLMTSLPSLIHVDISILDVNDNSPSFPQAFYNVSMVESAPIGSQIVLPSAIDPDQVENGTIERYDIEDPTDSPFRIAGDPPLLLIRLVSPLDRESQQLHVLNISATDGGTPPRKGYMLVYIRVMDVNDNEPVFNRKEGEMIEWNGKENQVLTKIEVSDADEGENGRVTLAVNDDYEDAFRIDDDNNLVSTKSLDCSSSCLVRITATDHGDPPLSSFTTVTLHHVHTNLYDPVISIRLSGSEVDFAVVGDEAPVGKVIAVLTLSDADGPIVGPSTLHAVSPPALFNQYFSLDTQGSFVLLRLKKIVPKELSTQIEVTFTANDGQSPARSTTNTLKIFLGGKWKAQSRSATIGSRTDTATVSMDAPVGSLVSIVRPHTRGSTYRMTSPTEYFEVDPHSGFVTVRSPLFNMNESSVHLDILSILPPPALEPSKITLTVYIKRVSMTSPVFIDLPESIEISESTLPGANVLTLKTNAQIGQVDYYLEDEEDRLEVERETGKISLKEPIDYEKYTQFIVLVKVADKSDPSKMSTAMLRILVKDANEFAPSFPCSDLHVSVGLSHPLLTPLTILIATDADDGPAGMVSYVLLDPLPAYSINPHTGVVLAHEAPTEEKTDTMRVSAVDGGGRASEKNVTLSIHWIRTGPIVVFNSGLSVLEVDEKTMTVGETIERYNTNIDSSTLTMEAPFLSLSPTGEVSLSSLPPPSVLRLSFRILAKSGDSMASLCGTMKINRLPPEPKFRRAEVTITLDESTVIGGPLARVSAACNNCSYGSECALLTVSREGVLALTMAAPRGIDHWSCGIKAEDEWGRTDSMKVNLIRRSYEMDKLPSHWTFYVSEGAEVGTLIGQLAGNDSAFIFESINNDDVIVFPDGRIFVRRELDRETRREYSGRVEITHARLSFFRSSGVYRVLVKDDNDNQPSCEQDRIIKVREDAEIGSIIDTIQSIDEDEGRNGIVSFTLNNNHDLVHVNVSTGELRLLQGLDAEGPSGPGPISLQYTVSDFGEPPLSSECTIRMEILDVNEHSPKFDRSIYAAIIDGKEGEEVVTVKANDEDFKWNKLHYSLKSHFKLFKINEATGKISVARRLPSNGLYSFIVRSLDNGEEPLATEVTVKVSVRDSRKAKPVFVPTNDTTIQIDRRTRVGDVVGHLQVDLPSTHSVAFSTLSGPLDIDWLGQLILVQPLRDRRLPLPSMIQAASSHGKTTARVTVVPQSEEMIGEIPKQMSVKENSRPGTLVGLLPASSSILFQFPATDTFKLTPTGELLTTRVIDREDGESTVFWLLVSHSVPPRSSLITVSIDDENDSSPACDGVKSFVVRELPTIFPISCRDPDQGENGTVRYRQLDEASSEAGGIRVRPEGTLVVTVLGDTVDRSRVEAFDRPSSSDSMRKRTEMEITLLKELPESNSLKFLNDELMVKVTSTTPIGKSIGRVEAVSKTTPRYFVTRSSFPAHEGAVVRVDEKSGHLFLLRVPSGSGKVTVTAVTADAMAHIEVELSMIGEMRQEPTRVFPIWKRTQKGTIVGRIHKDKDSKFSMEDTSSPFTVSPTGDIIVGSDLRGETTPSYRLVITVSSDDEDKGRSEQIVFVVLVDEHDHTETTNGEGILFVRENAHYGSVIGWMGDWTKEDGPYSIDGDEDTVGFRVDLTGLITLAREVDYEKSRLHSFSVILTSGRSLSFVVFVEDENEHSPKWFENQDSYSFSIAEDASIGTRVGRLFWTDDDDANLFTVSIIKGDPSGDFSIDNDGAITVSVHLDRETTPLYTLQVELRDHAAPYKFHSIRALVRITVIDINDNSPKFTSPSTFFVSEAARKNTVFGSVRAIDIDEGRNGTVRYRILPESLPHAEFIIDPLLGYLIVNKDLDFENRTQHEFTVTALDDGRPARVTEQTILVNIIDENDNMPEEIRIRELITVSEDAPRGHLLDAVTVVDKDGPEMSSSLFWLTKSSSSSLFSFTRSGRLIVNGPLDYENQPSYNITVSAKNIAGGDSIEKNVTVMLDDINDESPRFITGSNLFIRVSEALVGPFPVIIGSSIADDADANTRLAYSLLEGNSTLFSIDPTTGDLSLLGELDRESQPIHHLQVQATDSGSPRLSSQCDITIQVDDDNDLSPLFDLPLYEVHVKEGTTIGEKIIQMNAVDGDEGDNAIVRYSLVDNTSPFNIDQINGWISIGRSIDREEESEYLLTVKAQDSGRYFQRSSTTLVRILIDDVNDNSPMILNPQLDVYLSEQLEIGDVVWPIIASDADEGSTLSYSTDSSSPFVIDGNAGVLRLSTPLTQQHYSLVVTVRDNGGLNTTASFSFYMESARKFARFVDEGIEQTIRVTEGEEGVLLRARAVPREGTNITYSLLTPCADHFSIDARSGTMRYAKLKRKDSHCFTPFVVSTTSHIPPLSTILPVTVELEDANDHSPVFDKMLYTTTVNENGPEGTLLTVHATDEDDGANGEVYYQIEDGGNDIFEMDEESGELRSLGYIDREKTPIHTLTIVAKDRGVPQRAGRTTVKIRVIDENDNAPRFTRLYGVSVREDIEVPHRLITVEATDADCSGELVYSLEQDGDGALSIDSKTGDVTLLKQLDREETPSLRVGVLVSDGRWRVKTMLSVRVIDVNDNSPVFDRQEQIVWIGEDTQVGLVTILNAEDADEGDNAIIDYSIDQDQRFIGINPNGEVHVYELPKQCFKLSVTASDRGVPSRSTTIPLYILSSSCSFSPLRGIHSLPIISSLPIGSTVAVLDGPKEEDKGRFSLLSQSSSLLLESGGRLIKKDNREKRDSIIVLVENNRGILYAANITVFPWTEELPQVIEKSYSISLRDLTIGSTLKRLHSSPLPLLLQSPLPEWLSLSPPGRLTLLSPPPLHRLPLEIAVSLYYAGCPQCNASTVLHFSSEIQYLPLLERTHYTFYSHPLDTSVGCLHLSSPSKSIKFSLPSSPLPSISVNENTGCLSWWTGMQTTKVAVLASSTNSLQLAEVELRRMVTIGEISLQNRNMTVEVSERTPLGVIVGKVEAVGNDVVYIGENSDGLRVDRRRGELVVSGRPHQQKDNDMIVYARSGRSVQRATIRTSISQSDSPLLSALSPLTVSYPSGDLPIDIMSLNYSLPSNVEMRVEGDETESFCPEGSLLRLCGHLPSAHSPLSLTLYSSSNQLTLSRAPIIIRATPPTSLSTNQKRVLSSLSGWIRENSPPSAILRVVSAGTNVSYRIVDEDMAKVFSIDSSGIISSLVPLDRERRSLYLVPISLSTVPSIPSISSSLPQSLVLSAPSSRRSDSIIVRIHVDDDLDSEGKDVGLRVTVVDPVDGSIGLVHASRGDLLPYAPCDEVADEFYEVSSKCDLWPRSISTDLPSKHSLKMIGDGRKIEIAKEESMISLLPQSINMRVFSTLPAIASLLTDLRETYADMEILPLGISPTIEDDEWSIILVMKDRNENVMAVNETEAVIRSRVSKRFMHSLSLISLLPTRSCPSSCSSTCTVSSSFLPHSFSLRSESSLWSLPRMAIDIRCPSSHLSSHHHHISSCSTLTCNGECDGDHCVCPLGWRGMNCTEDVDECAISNPCPSQALCINTRGAYQCVCAGGSCGDEEKERMDMNKTGHKRVYGITQSSSLQAATRSVNYTLEFEIRTTSQLLPILPPLLFVVNGRLRLVSSNFSFPISSGAWHRISLRPHSLSISRCSSYGICPECNSDDCRAEFLRPLPTLLTLAVPRDNQPAFSSCLRSILLDGTPLLPSAHSVSSSCSVAPSICLSKEGLCRGVGADAGVCISDGDSAYKCACDGAIDAADCREVENSVSLEGGSVVLRVRDTVRGQMERNDVEEISIDFRTNEDSAQLMAFESKLHSTILEIRSGYIILSLRNESNRKSELKFASSRVDNGEWHRIHILLMKDKKVMRVRVDSDGKEIRSLHSFPSLISSSLQRLSLGPAHAICVKKLVVNRQLQPLLANATTLPHQILLPTWKGSVSISCPSFTSSSSLSSIFSWPIILILLLLLFFIVVSVLVVIRWQRFKKSKCQRADSTWSRRTTREFDGRINVAMEDRCETPGYEVPAQKLPPVDLTAQRSESSLYYHNFTSPDLYATRERSQFQHAYF